MLLNTRKKKTRDKFNPGLSANRSSNNWALDDNKTKTQSKSELLMIQTSSILFSFI